MSRNRKLRYGEPFKLYWNDLRFSSEIGICVLDIFVRFWFFHIAYHKIFVLVEIEMSAVLFTCLFIHNLPVIYFAIFSYYLYLFFKKKTVLCESTYLSTQLCCMYWIVLPTKRVWIAIPQIRMYFPNSATRAQIYLFSFNFPMY